MTRRSSKGDGALILLAVVIGLPIYLVSQVVEQVGWVLPVAAVFVVIVLVIWSKHHKKKKRLEYLRGKYQDEDVVQKIFAGTIWQGQSDEQLRDTLGDPAAVDRAVYKTKTKETWKYQQSGVNRFGLRVTVEDGCVVGWDKKA